MSSDSTTGRPSPVVPLEHKHFGAPDEVRTFEHGRMELVRVGDRDVARFCLQPGWRWSEHVGATQGRRWCDVQHVYYLARGSMHFELHDGEGIEAHEGEVVRLAAPHDGWVLGDDEVVMVDWGDDYSA